MAKKKGKSKPARSYPQSKATPKVDRSKSARDFAGFQSVVDGMPAEVLKALGIERDLLVSVARKTMKGNGPGKTDQRDIERKNRRRDLLGFHRVMKGIPKNKFCELAGRQNKVVNEMADRYDLECRNSKVDLELFIQSAFNLIAKYSRVISAARLSQNTGVGQEEMDMASGLGEKSPALEQYRLAKARLAQLELAEKSKHLVSIEEVKKLLGTFAGIVKSTCDSMQKLYGAEAYKQWAECVEDLEREIKDRFGSLDSDYGLFQHTNTVI